MAGDNESTISKLWKKYNETNFSDQKGMQGGYSNSVLPDNTKDSFNYNPRAPQENNSDSIKKLRDFVNPTIAPKIENATKNLPYSYYDPKGESVPSPVLVLPKINENTPQTDNQQQNTTKNNNQPQSIDSPNNSQESGSSDTTPPKNDTQENTPATDNKEESKSTIGDLISTIVGGVAGAFVGGVSNPFSGSADSNVGSLSAGGSSVSSVLNSTPSGGDSGIVGESQFGGDSVQGKSTVEILSQIYKVLTQTNTTTNQIAKDIATLAKNQTQQDISSDISSTNAKARQNEGAINSSSPVYTDNSSKIEKEDEEDSSILGSIADWFTGGKKKKNGAKNLAKKAEKEAAEDAIDETAKSAADSAVKKGGLKGAFTGPKAKKIAGGAAALGLGGAAGAMLGENYGEDNPSVFGGNMPQQNNNAKVEPTPNSESGNTVDIYPDSNGVMMKQNMETGEETRATDDDIQKNKENTDNQTSQPESTVNKPSYEEHLTTTVSNTKTSSENGKPAVSESSNNTTTSNFKSKPNPIKVSGNRPYVLQDDGEGGKMKYDLETTELTPASSDDIKDAELQQQQDAIANNKNLTVDEANAQSQEIWKQQQDIEYNRINKENPTPGIDTVENVSDTKEFKEKYGNTSTDSGKSSSSPVTPYNYQSQITESKNSGLSDLEKEKQSKLEAIGARRGKEGEDDAALDAEGETVLDEFNSKKQSSTATPIPNSDSDGLNDRERGEADAYKDKVANSGMYKKVTPSTFGKATEAGNAMVNEVGGIDKRQKELKAELEQQSMHTAYSDKESMDKDLNHLNEIYAERDKLTEKRNEITATDEYRNAAHERKAGNQQQAQPTPSSPTKAPPSAPPPTTAGTGKDIPNVRNNDPTIRMMEQGNMWSTHVS